MIRRSFFQTLVAALLPQPVIAVAKTLQPGCEPPARTLHHPAPVMDPDWLREWREIPKMEVFAKDLPYHENPHQQALDLRGDLRGRVPLLRGRFLLGTHR